MSRCHDAVAAPVTRTHINGGWVKGGWACGWVSELSDRLVNFTPLGHLAGGMTGSIGRPGWRNSMPVLSLAPITHAERSDTATSQHAIAGTSDRRIGHSEIYLATESKQPHLAGSSDPDYLAIEGALWC